jgi:hypothetical protein
MPSDSDPVVISTTPNEITGISGADMYELYKYFGNINDFLQILIMKEMGGWWQNQGAFEAFEQALVTRFYDYANHNCSAVSFNCLMNWWAIYSESASKAYNEIMVTNKGNEDPKYWLKWYGKEVTNGAGIVKGDQAMIIANSFLNPQKEWLTVDINGPYDIGILPATITNNPQQVVFANQFLYFMVSTYDFDKNGTQDPAYSLILTYSQWQYWLNNGYLVPGSQLAP